MANQIKIDLSLTGEQSTARGLKNVGDAADKAGDDLTGLGKDAGQLNKKIAETRAEVEKLTKAFDQTGDMDLLKSIRKEQSNLRIFERLAKSIMDEAQEIGTQAGQKVGESLTKSLMALRGPAIAGAVGIGALFAPAIGAAVSAAVIGGAGTGGIIGGIVAASQDQRVQSAAKMVGDRVGSALTDAGGPFVEPLIESLRLLDQAGDRLAANFQAAGTKIAPTLVPLTKGLAGFVDEVMPGFIRAMDAAKPVIRAISAELPKIGMAISEFFDKLSKDPDEAVVAVVAISQAAQGAIEFVGDLADKLGALFEMNARAGAAISGTWETLFGWMPIVGDIVKDQGRNFREQVAAIDAAKDASKDFAGNGIGPIIRAQEEMAEITKTATDKIKDQTTAMDKMFGRFMDSREVARNYQEAIDELTESVKEHGTSLDIGTEAGRTNSEALDNLATKIKDARENTILMTGDVAGANTVYYEQVEALRQQAIKLGFSKQAANDLAAGLRDIPRQVDVEVRAPGLLEAIARAEYLRRLLGSNAAAARSNPITINGQFYPGDDSGYGGGRAGGGPMSAGKWYTVGEDGVEVVAMHPGGGATVYNNKQTGAMMSGASGGAAMAVRPQVGVYLVPSGSPDMDAVVRALWPAICKQVRVEGGDLVAIGAA